MITAVVIFNAECVDLILCGDCIVTILIGKVYVTHCRNNVLCNIFLSNDFELFGTEKSFLEICHMKSE
jgi:hypothetical protein